MPPSDTRLLRYVVWMTGILLALLLGLVGWVLWVSTSDSTVSNRDLLREQQITNCILLVDLPDRDQRSIQDCLDDLP